MTIAAGLEIQILTNLARLHSDMRSAQTSVDGSMRKISKSVDFAKNSLAALGLGFGVYKLAGMISEVATLSTRYDELGIVMEVVGRNSGINRQQLDEQEAALKRTGISAIESRSNIAKLIQANIDLSKSTELARLAQDAAVIGGLNSSDAFARLVRGIQTAEVETLRNIGLNVSFEESYKKMEKQLGVTGGSLNQFQKIQARTNEVLALAPQIAGAYEGAMSNAGKQMRSSTRYVEDFKVKMGQTFNEAMVVSVMGFTNAIKGANGEVDELAANGKLEEWGADIVDIMAFVGDSVVSVGATFRLTGSWLAEMAAVASTLGTAGGRQRVPSIRQAAEEERRQILETTSMFRDALAERRKAKLDDAANKDPIIEQGIVDAGANRKFLERLKLEEDAKVEAQIKAGEKATKAEQKAYESRLGFHQKAMQDMAGFTLELIKSNEIEKSASEILQDKLDAYTSMEPALRAYNQSLIDNVKAQEAAQKTMEAVNLRNDAIRNEAQQAESDFQEKVSLDKRLEDENQQLNIALIKSDSERAVAQLAIEHQRIMDEIAMLQASAEEKQRLSDAELKNYEMRVNAAQKATSEMDEFSKNAARAMQDSFADFLFDPFEKGLDGMLKGFLETMQRMVAQAAAAQIVRSIFEGTSFGSMLGLGGGYSPLPDFVPATYASGTNYVPRDGMAFLHRGEKVIQPSHAGDSGGAVSVVVNVDANNSSVQGDNTKANDFGQMISAAVQKVIIKEKGAGGLLSS